jgi:putative restriction endonuclease
MRLLLSKQISDVLSQRAMAENFGAYSGQPLQLSKDAVLPDLAFLAEHRAKIFRKS